MAAEAPDQPHPQPGNPLMASTGIQTEPEKAPAPAAFNTPPQPPPAAGANAPLSTASLQTPPLPSVNAPLSTTPSPVLPTASVHAPPAFTAPEPNVAVQLSPAQLAGVNALTRLPVSEEGRESPPGQEHMDMAISPRQEHVNTAESTAVESEQTIQPILPNHPNPGLIDIPVVEDKQKGQNASGQPIHIPRYLKNNRTINWEHLPPSSINSPVIAQQRLAGVKSPLPGLNTGGANAPLQLGGVNSPAGNSPTPLIPQRPVAVNTPGVGLQASNLQQGVDTPPSKAQQRPLLPAQVPTTPVFNGAQGGHSMMATLVSPQQQNLYTVSGTVPNLTFSPVMGTIPASGQVVQLNFTPPPLQVAQQYARPPGAAGPSAPMRRPPNMLGDVPKAKDAEKRRERERVRRAIMANIVSGLRNYGGYNLPQNAPDIEYIRALLREAGYVTNVDGTTYRRGAIPNATMEHPSDMATSPRDDFAAQDTPPSTFAEPGGHNHLFREETGTEQGDVTGGEEREAGGGEETGNVEEEGSANPPEQASERVTEAPELADMLIVEPLDEGEGKRSLENGEEGQEAKRPRAS